MYTWIFVSGILFSFYNAWGGGANDCANSFATAVGSKSVTLKQAILIASVFEFAGAVLMGSLVTDTVRKKIVSQDIFEDDPGALMLGMLCADLASALWLTFATYFKYPVSTTHSIIGAIVGFCLAYGGTEAVVWDKIGFIVLSWFVSPVLSGVFSYISFKAMTRYVFDSSNSFRNTTRVFPILTFVTFFINSLFIIYKGSPQLDLDEIEAWKASLISIGIASGTALLSWYVYLPYAKKRVDQFFSRDGNGNEEGRVEEIELSSRTNSYIDVVQNNADTDTDANNESVVDTESADNNEEREEDDINKFEYNNEISIDENIKESKKYTSELRQRKKNKEHAELYQHSFKVDEKSDKLCCWLQIFTSCFSSFAHGSNDVANAIGPLATIYSIYETNSVEKKTDVPLWILALGGAGIVFGLATWGYKIINRLGKDLTKISASRGFLIELSAATTIIIASRTEMPVSTTHCQVGSIVGCGLTGGTKNVKWSLLKGILFSWFITLPVTGFLSAGLFSWGYYSPSTLTNFTLG
jgi:sodium-dependent phosphate transporter